MEDDKKALALRTLHWGENHNPDGTKTIKLKLSFEGSIRAMIRSEGKDSWGVEEIIRLFSIGKAAWIAGDYETVADFFGILT